MQNSRYLEAVIREDLREKMVFLGGPRQVGKTTVAKRLLAASGRPPNEGYLNWDAADDRRLIMEGLLPGPPGLVVYDEIHKYSRWRNLLKGLFDKHRERYQFLVTGSARLDYYRRGGDSLQGRYHFHRLHPLSFAEIGGQSRDDLMALFTLGGFPEPFFSGSELKARRWSREYRQRLVLGELPQLERVCEIALVERLVGRLPDLVGSPLSLNSLREDLGVSHPTIARWMEILERLYAIFRIYPFGAPKIRAVKKEAKHYHFDWTLIKDEGLRFENMVACHLLKWCHWREDTLAEEIELRYFRDTDKREVDFVIVRDGRPIRFIESKRSESREASPHLKYLHARFPEVEAIQVSLEGDYDLYTPAGIRLMSATRFLKDLV
ncbi:MAG: AAA family ATPase [Candidatus Ozemobacter sibiricus]|jgi:predicted AAA+ superfamily ATPase|uniref:AAA family ATPase n=1 Tax=Candidatus Ozemobacter sibiricus TaxID=2268124 RepID=A0A367ZSV9_9BACT|nr:MAG: AAA family ATPase [Candidatus Ozemobacter sibiricus]